MIPAAKGRCRCKNAFVQPGHLELNNEGGASAEREGDRERKAGGRTGAEPSALRQRVSSCAYKKIRFNTFNFVTSLETESWVKKLKKTLNKFMKKIHSKSLFYICNTV